MMKASIFRFLPEHFQENQISFSFNYKNWHGCRIINNEERRRQQKQK